MLNVLIGSDHRGVLLKNKIREHILNFWSEKVREIVDLGASQSDGRVDYPVYAQRLCKELLGMKRDGIPAKGILICGSGAGMAIAANRFREIYGVLAFSENQGRAAIRDDMANVLIFPADFIETPEALKIVDFWITAEPPEGRHLERLKMCDILSQGGENLLN